MFSRKPPFDDLVLAFRERRRLALARTISIVEDQSDGFERLLHELLSRPSARSARVGITGPPGAGKSTLVAASVRWCRDRDEEVGVLAVDPTSPFSGGALLGDRVRMPDLAGDPGVFVRSMATRGSLGGLATAASEVLDVMEAFGFARLLVETVGVGQAEIEVASATDSVVVVLVPESGDAIQAMKAGLMEIADLFVVNKRDRPGADRLAEELRSALEWRSRREDGEARWTVPVITAEALSGAGVADLWAELERHREHLVVSGELEQRRDTRTADRIAGVLDREMRRRARTILTREGFLESALERVRSGVATPYSIVRELLARDGELSGRSGKLRE